MTSHVKNNQIQLLLEWPCLAYILSLIHVYAYIHSLIHVCVCVLSGTQIFINVKFACIFNSLCKFFSVWFLVACIFNRWKIVWVLFNRTISDSLPVLDSDLPVLYQTVTFWLIRFLTTEVKTSTLNVKSNWLLNEYRV